MYAITQRTRRHLIGSPSAAPQHDRFGAELGGRGSGRNSDEQHSQAHELPWTLVVPGWGRLCCPRSPGPSFPHQNQGLPESVVITMLHQSATGRKSLLWGGLDPSGLRLRLLQNRSVTQSMGMGHGVLPRSRYPYPVPRIRMCTCTISSRSSVTASTAFLWTIRPHERRTSTLNYLFVFSSAFICTFRLCPVLSALGASLYLSVLPHPVYHQLRCQTNKSPPPSHTQLHNGRFCSRCCQGHQVRA